VVNLEKETTGPQWLSSQYLKTATVE